MWDELRIVRRIIFIEKHKQILKCSLEAADNVDNSENILLGILRRSIVLIASCNDILCNLNYRNNIGCDSKGFHPCRVDRGRSTNKRKCVANGPAARPSSTRVRDDDVRQAKNAPLRNEPTSFLCDLQRPNQPLPTQLPPISQLIRRQQL